MQFRLIQLKRLLNSFYFKELHICKTLWLAKLVCQNGNPVHSTTRLEMLLHFFRRACIINLQAQIQPNSNKSFDQQQQLMFFTIQQFQSPICQSHNIVFTIHHWHLLILNQQHICWLIIVNLPFTEICSPTKCSIFISHNALTKC